MKKTRFNLKSIFEWYLKIPSYVAPHNIRNYRVWSYAIPMGFLYCFTWIFLSYYINAFPMFVFNIFASIFWLTAFISLKKGKMVKLFAILNILEVILYAVFAVHFAGWDYGFQYIVFAIPCGVYMIVVLRKQVKLLLTIMSIGSFIFMWFYSLDITHPVKYKIIPDIICIVNIILAFFFIAIFTYFLDKLFMISVKKAPRTDHQAYRDKRGPCRGQQKAPRARQSKVKLSCQHLP